MYFLKIWLTITFTLTFFTEATTQTRYMNTVTIKGLRTTIYKVDDLEAATAWYASCFGIKPYFQEPFYVGFSIGGFELGLLPEASTEPRTTNVLSYWAVDDITDAFDKMVTAGAKELEAPVDVGGGIKVALVKDPWQNVIGLIYNPAFKIGYPSQAIVEFAAFTLAESASESELLVAAKRLDMEFLSKQKGFIQRELLKKSESEYVDLVFWESEELAKLAMAQAETSDVCGAYFSLMKIPDAASANEIVQHFKLITY